MNDKSRKVLVATISVALVVVIVAMLVVVFTNQNKNIQGDINIAQKNYDILNSDDYKNLEENISSDLSASDTSAVNTYAQSLQTSDSALSKAYSMLHLQYSMQWTMAQALTNDTVFGGNQKSLQKIESCFDAYATKLSATMEAVAIFNIDSALSTTTSSTKLAEFKKIMQCLIDQTTTLITLNDNMLEVVKQNNYTEQASNGIPRDLKIMFLQMFNAQGNILQNAVVEVCKDDVVKDVNQTTYSDAQLLLNAYKNADSANFVYATINENITDCTVEGFVSAFNLNIAEVNAWLNSTDKSAYVTTLSDENKNKQSIMVLNLFLTKLAG